MNFGRCDVYVLLRKIYSEGQKARQQVLPKDFGPPNRPGSFPFLHSTPRRLPKLSPSNLHGSLYFSAQQIMILVGQSINAVLAGAGAGARISFPEHREMMALLVE
jgi:hypothetical protein